jgi:integrase
MRPTGLKSYDKRTKKAVFECSVPGTRGHKRIRKVVKVESWDDLLTKLAAFRDSVQHPERATPLSGETPTLRAYSTNAWESITSRLSDAKRKNQHALLQHHLLPSLGNVRLDQMTIAHLEDFVSTMQRKQHGDKQPYSNATINTCLQLVRKILKHAWRRRILTDYPLREKLPLLPEPIVQNELNVDEREAFLASFDNEPGFRSHFTTTALAKRKDRKHQPPKPESTFVTYAFERVQWSKPLFVLALYTGLRRSDLRLLKWTSIDLSAGVIRLIMRKTKRPVLLPIVPRVRQAPVMCRKRTVMSEYVLLTPEGRPYSESTIKRYFKTAKAIAGITRRFRFHDQRHTFASTLASKGINSFTLRDLLGHTSTRTTERYARPSAETLAAVIHALA